jgi:hypothetical protein
MTEDHGAAGNFLAILAIDVPCYLRLSHRNNCSSHTFELQQRLKCVCPGEAALEKRRKGSRMRICRDAKRETF